MNGNTGGIWHGSQVPPPPLQVLGEAEDGGADGKVIWITLPQRERRHSGRPNVAHHLQCGGGRGGPPLGILGGGTGGGGSSDEDGDVAQTAERTIQEQDDGRRHAEEGHARLTVKAELFYVDDGLVASTYPGWLQSPFGMLTGIFNWVGLRKNLCKTVGVVCRPCRAAGVRVDKTYTQQMTGEGRIFKERQR